MFKLPQKVGKHVKPSGFDRTNIFTFDPLHCRQMGIFHILSKISSPKHGAEEKQISLLWLIGQHGLGATLSVYKQGSRFAGSLLQAAEAQAC